MEKGFLDKVEDNAAVQTWSETTQQKKGDSLVEGYVSEFYSDLPYLLDLKVDKHLFRAVAQFWNPAYSCFTFGKVDLVPMVEEYTTLLRCSKIQLDKAYSRAANVPTFLKKLTNITGMSEQWVAARINQKGDSKCIPWKNLKDLILAHPDTRKKVDVFALGIYGLVVFPKALGHIDEAVTDLFDHLDKGITPVPAILAETFRSLNECRRVGEGRFIGCTQFFLAWFHSHFWKVDKVSYRDDISEKKWMATLQNLQEGDIEWRAPWMLSDEILYRCGDFDWVPLLGIWGAIGYALLLVLRQYRSRQFVPTTHGLAQCEFSYKCDGYKKKIREMTNAWRQTRRLKRLAVGPSTTPEYISWLGRRVNDNIPVPGQGDKIIKQDFERRNSELEKKIEQMEEEKMNLRLDIDVQKLETEGLRKGKCKVEEDLNSLKIDYKRLRLLVRTAGLGKTSEQWRQEVQEEKAKADRWEKRFQEAQKQNKSFERSSRGELCMRIRVGIGSPEG
ncbi:hypothetical protein V6Z11_D03G073000 [Gossypium hirsutum]